MSNDRIIETGEGLAQVGGDRAIYGRLLALLADNLAESLNNIRTQINSQDYLGAAAEAHKIKGIAANVGAKALFRSMQQLEAELHRDASKYPVMLGELETLKDEVFAEVAEFLAS